MSNKNNYPFHIEKQQEQLYKNIILRLSKLVIPKLKKQFRQEEKKIIQFDAENFGELEGELLEEFEKKMLASGFIANEVEKVAFLLDSWTVEKTKQSVKRLQRIKRRTAKSVIPIIFEPDNPFVIDFIDSYIASNVELVASLGRKFIPEVSKLASDTFLQGGNIKDLSSNLLQFTDQNVNRAAFWARDQVGDAYSNLTKTRQTSAGINNYIWRTVGDNAVRGNDPADETSHIILDGKIFSWTKGAADTGQISKPSGKHPGDDYNCRCTADPTFEEIK
jgi:SPP1 gp7 family putative phage head morphogenesis protein